MKLYKYRGFKDGSSEKTWTKKILSEQELFFSGIEAFNDPFDGKVKLTFNGTLNQIKAAQIRVQYSNKLVKDGKYEGISIKDASELVNNRITEDLIKDPQYKIDLEKRVQEIHNKKGVLSLSSVNNNILMWSHYSDNHKGICFGFDWDEKDVLFGKYKKVRYQTHYDDVWSWINTDKEIVNKIIYNKSIDWNYEKEYRIITNEIKAVKFEKTNLKEIIFGCKTPQKDIDEIINLANKYNLKINFKRAVIDVNRYALNIIKYKK
jgi:hypothetical protein